MILHTQPGKKWNIHDFLLLEAYQILESERCGQCGLPRYICHTEDQNLQFHIVEDQCAAKAQVEDHEKTRSSRAGYEKPSGTIMRPDPYTVDGADFVTLREPFYKAEWAHKQETSELPV